MARYNKSIYQYETSPRKLKPEYEYIEKEYPKKSTAKKTVTKVKKKRKSNSKAVLYIGIVFVILFAVSYRNALIAQKYSEIRTLKTSLSELYKENKQLEVNIESKTNLGAIEEKGAKELGLKKIDDSQIVYVNLDKQDYVEPSDEQVNLSEGQNWLENIISKIKNIFVHDTSK